MACFLNVRGLKANPAPRESFQSRKNIYNAYFWTLASYHATPWVATSLNKCFRLSTSRLWLVHGLPESIKMQDLQRVEPEVRLNMHLLSSPVSRSNSRSQHRKGWAIFVKHLLQLASCKGIYALDMGIQSRLVLLFPECSWRPGLLTPGLFLQTRLLWHNPSETFLGSREGVYEQERKLPNSKRCNCMGDDPDWALSVCQVAASAGYVPK